MKEPVNSIIAALGQSELTHRRLSTKCPHHVALCTLGTTVAQEDPKEIQAVRESLDYVLDSIPFLIRAFQEKYQHAGKRKEDRAAYQLFDGVLFWNAGLLDHEYRWRSVSSLLSTSSIYRDVKEVWGDSMILDEFGLAIAFPGCVEAISHIDLDPVPFSGLFQSARIILNHVQSLHIILSGTQTADSYLSDTS